MCSQILSLIKKNTHTTLKSTSSFLIKYVSDVHSLSLSYIYIYIYIYIYTLTTWQLYSKKERQWKILRHFLRNAVMKYFGLNVMFCIHFSIQGSLTFVEPSTTPETCVATNEAAFLSRVESFSISFIWHFSFADFQRIINVQGGPLKAKCVWFSVRFLSITI